MNSNYDVKPLLDMAQAFLTAEEDYRRFCLTFKGGWVANIPAEEYGEYIRKESASSYTWSALRDACKVVSADMSAVIATAKAINRYEARERWQVCVFHPEPYRSDADRLRRFWASGDEWRGHFHSTGRRYPWAA